MKKIILPAVLIICLFAIFAPGLFIKINAECRSQFGECPADIQRSLSSANGKSIYRARRIIESDLKTNFLISNFTIQFKLPNILKINILVKKPVFALKNSSGNFDLVESEGTVVAQATENSLPYVAMADNLPDVGTFVGDKYLLALKLIDGVNKMYQINSGNIETDTLLVDLPQGIRVIFPLEGYSREVLLGSLRLIYSDIQSGENGNSYSQIDLRYTNPVLR